MGTASRPRVTITPGPTGTAAASADARLTARVKARTPAPSVMANYAASSSSMGRYASRAKPSKMVTHRDYSGTGEMPRKRVP